MSKVFADLARQLAMRAEAVCRRYLSNGQRDGRYWVVGDPYNTPGRSMFVRLVARDGDRARAGKWTDAATGDHGDLLDVIALSLGHARKRDTLDEARRFLSIAPASFEDDAMARSARSSRSRGTPEAARRLFAAARPIEGSVAQRYLAARAIVMGRPTPALRFHPNCHYRPSRFDRPGTRAAWPALIAAVTDINGSIMGVQRSWLDPVTFAKAPIATPRRAMGNLLGHGVRFGSAGDVMAAGEGIETMLSVRAMLPDMAMIAALSAAHLAALAFPPQLRRLYVAHDNDQAGQGALARLTERGRHAGILVMPLSPELDDFNDDHRLLGTTNVRGRLREQLHPDDAGRFLDGDVPLPRRLASLPDELSRGTRADRPC